MFVWISNLHFHDAWLLLYINLFLDLEHALIDCDNYDLKRVSLTQRFKLIVILKSEIDFKLLIK